METLRTYVRKSHVQLITGGILLFVIFLGIGAIIAQKLSPTTQEIPASIAQKVKFPVYLPKELPGSYQLEAQSFVVREAALLFGIKDKSGNSMAFSEQARTTTMNFATIYEQQFKSVQKLTGTPYPSVIGKTNDEKMHLLSIETPDTWILVSAATTNDDELKTIAKHINKQ